MCSFHPVFSDVGVINSMIDSHTTLVGKDSLIENSHLQGTWNVGIGCLVSGVRPWVSPQTLAAHSVFSVVPIVRKGTFGTVVLKFGARDNPNLDFQHPQATYNGLPWTKFFELSGLSGDDIWPMAQKEGESSGANLEDTDGETNLPNRTNRN